MGATGEYTTRSGGKVHIHLVSNPSHLEAVDPVTVGRTRAKQDRTEEGGREKYLPFNIQGVSVTTNFFPPRLCAVRIGVSTRTYFAFRTGLSSQMLNSGLGLVYKTTRQQHVRYG